MFWVLGGAAAASSAIGTALNFHQIDLLGEQGLEPIEAAANFVPQTIGTLSMTLAVGALVDRVHERWLLVGGMVMLIAAMLMVPRVSPGLIALAYGLLLGASGAVMRAVEAAVTPRLYGLAQLGSIRGVLRSITVAASAVGPVVVAVGRDLTGSYAGVLVLLLVVPAGLGVAALVTPTPPPGATHDGRAGRPDGPGV